MDSTDESFAGITLERALWLLEENKKKQKLLEQRIQELQNSHEEETIGPLCISQTATTDTLVISGLDRDYCQIFLQNYLGQTEKYSNRRRTEPKSKSIINGENTTINLALPKKMDVNTKVTYDVERQELRFEIIKGKTKIERVEPFKNYLIEKLRHFVRSNYTDMLFETQLYAEGKVVEFDEEFSSSIITSTSDNLLAASTTELPRIEAAKKVSARDRSGSGSTDSGPQKGNIVNTNFFVKTMVNPNTAGLSFAVSTLRPDTYLGRQQGAHITAYIVFVTAILETVDEQDITDIPELLVAAAKQFVPSSQWDRFQETLQELIRENPFFEKKERKRLTAGLRKTVQESTVQSIKKSVKVHYAAVLAHFIDDLANQILMAINQSENTLYARAGRPKTRQELGHEGAKIRNAMKELRKISASLIEAAGHSDMATESVNEPRVETLRARMRTQSSASNLSETNMNLQDKIAIHMFELFDFDYYEYTSSAILGKIESSVLEEMRNLEKKLPRSKKDRKKGLTVEQVEAANKIKRCEEILEHLSEIEELSTPKERLDALRDIQQNDQHTLNTLLRQLSIDNAASQISEAMKNISEKAPEIIAQHVEIVMTQAFTGLQNLSPSDWKSVCEKFTRMVGENFHWNDRPEVMEKIPKVLPKHLNMLNASESEETTIDNTTSSQKFDNF